jgi:hypothetical protein
LNESLFSIEWAIFYNISAIIVVDLFVLSFLVHFIFLNNMKEMKNNSASRRRGLFSMIFAPIFLAC